MHAASKARKIAGTAVSLAVVLLLLLAAAFATTPSGSAQAMGARPAKAKNVIVMVSDGWGYNHVQATDYYEAGRNKAQAYERFPVRLGMSTYEYELVDGAYKLLGYDPLRAWREFDYVKRDATDSASAATAMSTGVKTRNGAIGVDIYDNPLKHAAERAEELGMATGVITSVQLSHATPAGFVAHNPSRNKYEEIAAEMIESSATDVIMGCGHPFYDNDGNYRFQGYSFVGGEATWNSLLAGTAGAGVDADHNGVLDDAWTLIETREEFQALASGTAPKRLCGVARAYSTLQQSRSGDGKADPFEVPFNEDVPTLAEMARAALNVLDDDPDGLFLMIEGGAVDWASHANQSGRMIEEQMDFNAAVEAVIAWVRENSNWGETILIVTGDHECGYLCGPGSEDSQKMLPILNNGAGSLPGMEWNSTDHTNSLIPVFAKGWGAQSIKRFIRGYGPVRGPYMDNTGIAALIFSLLR